MTEEEWMDCTDPGEMFRVLVGKASDRKMRLFACACCRRVWNLLDEGSRKAVEVAERFADGQASDQELAEARKLYGGPFTLTGFEVIDLPDVTSENTFGAASGAMARAEMLLLSVGRAGTHAGLTPEDFMRRDAEKAAQCDLLNDIFGNPFRPTPIDRAWLAWNGGAVRRRAQAIYDDRAFDRLPLLADALQDAGCTDEGILGHCRGPGPHVRGCWVVDLLLGRQ
jgi:hypothetical protein